MNINFFGDFCQEGRTKRFSLDDYAHSWGSLSGLLASGDYNIVNLECAPDIRRGREILKVGPHLACSETALWALKKSGFHCLALANNHFADYGPDSVIDSIQLIDSIGFDHVGAGDCLLSARKPLMVSIGEKTVAIVNCCEHEFTLADENKAGCNPLDPISQFEAIRNASRNADYVIVFVHGGSEHYELPTPRMQSSYRYFIDCGADLVVNCHQHLFSGFEYYQDKPIVYGLGNFFFDSLERQDTPWNYGYVLHVSIEDKLTIELFPYKQCNGEPVVELLDDEERRVFDIKISQLNSVIQDPLELRLAYDKWVKDKGPSYLYPLASKTQKGFVSRKWDRAKQIIFNKKAPQNKDLTRAQQLMLYSFTNCESHRDVFLSVLSKQLGREQE